MLSFFDYMLHEIILIVSFITVVLLIVFHYLYPDYNPKQKSLIKIFFYYMLSFLFAAFRWAGGSLSHIREKFTDGLIYNILWTLVGIAAAVFGLYASKLLLDFSKLNGDSK